MSLRDVKRLHGPAALRATESAVCHTGPPLAGLGVVCRASWRKLCAGTICLVEVFCAVS